VPLVTTGDALFLASLIVGGLVAAGCGYLVGLPSLRLRGDYLAIVTLGFGEIVRVLIQSQTTETLAPGTKVKPEHLTTISTWEGSKFTTDQLATLAREQPGFVAPPNADMITAADIGQVPMHLWPLYSGGSLGFSRLPQYNSLFWVVLLGVVTLIVAYRLKNSSMGRALLSIREDEIASEAMGVRTTRYKIYAFVIAAFFAGIAGGLFAHTTGVQLSAGELGFVKSFDIIIMVVLGGLGSISGAALAAVIVTILPELLRKPAELAAIWPWALGLGVVAWILVAVLKDKPRARGIAKAVGVLSLMALGLALAAKLATTYGVDLTQYRMVLFALALILMMILRPQGLLGVREIWEKALWRPRRAGAAKGVKG
jgi:ABC-type branched-subunit amino acid transport system permease subunit